MNTNSPLPTLPHSGEAVAPSSTDSMAGGLCPSPVISTHTASPLELATQDAQERYDRLCLQRRSKEAAEALERLRAARHAQLAAEIARG